MNQVQDVQGAAANPVDLDIGYWDEAARVERMAMVVGKERLQRSMLARAIAPMLIALDWFGAPRSLAALLPEPGRAVDIAHIRFILSALGFRSELVRSGNVRAETESLPIGSIVLDDAGNCSVYLGRPEGDDWWWHDGAIAKECAIGRGQVLRIHRDIEHQPLGAPQPLWFNALIERFGGQIGQLVFVSFFINVLALAVSIYVMLVYGHVIPSGITVTLGTLFLMVFLAIMGGWLLRLGRAKAIGGISAWVGAHISSLALLKSLGMPYEALARNGVQANSGRVRSAENIRQFFSSQAGTNLIDYPFVVIFLAAIAVMGGWLVIVPVVSLLTYAAISIPVARYIAVAGERAGRANGRLNEETLALVRRVRELGGIGGRETWLRRYADVVHQNALANRGNAVAMALSQNIARTLAPLTVLSTLVVGVSLVLGGLMHPAGLIASMMLIWRVTTPAQQAFNSLLRLRQMQGTFRQVDALMRTTGDGGASQITSPVIPVSPSLNVDRLFYRFSAEQEPALNSVSFAVEAGTRVALVGPNGAGKSTLLTCIAGLRAPLNGRILVDGRDIRQFDSNDFRAWIGFLPQDLRGLRLSVRDYLTLAHPELDDAALEAALLRVGGPDWARLIEGAVSTPVTLSSLIAPWRDDRAARRGRLLIALAEATIVDPPILLLDHPEIEGDPEIAARLTSVLDALRGRSTVIVATHDPAIIKSADHLLVLDQGNLVHAGPVAQENTVKAVGD